MSASPSPLDAGRTAADRFTHHRAIPREAWPLLALLALLAFNLAFTPGFFRVWVTDDGRELKGIVIDIADRAAPVMLLAIGMTLVIATGGVDLSVGAVMAISGAVAAHLLEERGQPLWLALGAALGASLLAGAWNGALVAYLRVQPIVATLILMVSGRGLAQLVSDGQIITINPAEHRGFAMIGNGSLFMLPFTLTLVAAALLAVGLLTRRTAAGLFIEAVGNNRVASRFAGINERLVTLTVYAITGLCAGVAGLIAASDINAADANNAGQYLELDAILAVVIGGTALSGGRFYLLGAMVGALIIQAMSTTILTRNVPVEMTLVVKALVVVFVCLLQAPRFREVVLAPLRRRAAGGVA